MNRTIYANKQVGEVIWPKAQRIASIKGETVAAVIARALGQYVRENSDAELIKQLRKENL